jgi:hypothetical protein
MIFGLTVAAVIDFDSAVVLFELFDERDIFLKDTFNVLSLSSDDK